MYERFYKSAKYFGSNEILKKYLKVKDKYIMPLTIPHGIEFGFSTKSIIDINSFEPSYLAHNNYIFEKAKKIKKTIKFPHPWIFLIRNKKIKKGNGDLIISPPPSNENFDKLSNAIKNIKFNKVKSILIKGRNEDNFYFDWCKQKGFKPEFAGNIYEKNFYYNLFNILNRYRNIYLINMSSAGIFAASLGKKINIIKNCSYEDIDTFIAPKRKSENFFLVRKTWINITSSNKFKSVSYAKKILGNNFYTNQIDMKNILIQNYNQIKDKPLFLPKIKKKNYKYFIKVIHFFPFLLKFYPDPIKKICSWLFRLVKLNEIKIITYNDFGYFKIKGKYKNYKYSSKKGYKLKNFDLGEAPLKK